MSAPRIGSLFSGYGGLEQGVQSVLGGSTAWVSDIDKGACKILAHRYPDVPNLGDISTVDWSAFVDDVDVLTGGFPCQDVSHAGKRAGLRPDTRTGLWSQMAYAIDQLRPGLVVAENVRGLLSAEAHSDVEPCPWCMGDGGDVPVLRALGAVLGDLADLGYDAVWYGLRAADVGAPHGRFRVFVVAYPQGDTGRLGHGDGAVAADSDERGRRATGRDHGVRATGLEPGDRPLLPTPATSDTNGAGAHGDGGLDLRTAVSLLGTPRASEWKGSGPVGSATLADLVFDGHRWGDYAGAISRWERMLGRPAPEPTQTSTKGNPQLAPAFVEWMMGLPAGWVTDVPGITRNEALKACGNGVVPQQAAAALRVLLPAIEVAA